MPNLKFLASTVPEIWKGSQKSLMTHSLTHSLTDTQTGFIMSNAADALGR